ncbi:unnamed protein product [Paramecium octaurelia]|uniref:Tetratricopeptide repeat protein n=1 Tax=Paramecium octaurelia TaxID=43137 RepID=A0A8S1S934_PAROT|nr:unnamed protein product [Paramecium octaurelia]
MTNQSDQSILEFNKAIKFGEKDSYLHKILLFNQLQHHLKLELTIIQLIKHQDEQAIKEFEKAKDQDLKVLKYQSLKAQQYLTIQNYQKQILFKLNTSTINKFDVSIQLDPQNVEYYNSKGQQLCQLVHALFESIQVKFIQLEIYINKQFLRFLKPQIKHKQFHFIHQYSCRQYSKLSGQTFDPAQDSSFCYLSLS